VYGVATGADLRELYIVSEMQGLPRIDGQGVVLRLVSSRLYCCFESRGKEAMTNTQLLRDLLAIIHRDGGYHTEKVGIEKSVRDAKEVFWQLSRERDAALIRVRQFEESKP
jgi:hypothetical protein